MDFAQQPRYKLNGNMPVLIISSEFVKRVGSFGLALFLFLGCVKSPCIVVVDVTFKNSGISATATKKIKCGNYISFPFNVATKSPAFIEVNFFQGARVVRADVVYGNEFNNETFFRQYSFPDTDPDLMIWRVYNLDRTWIEYRTKL